MLFKIRQKMFDLFFQGGRKVGIYMDLKGKLRMLGLNAIHSERLHEPVNQFVPRVSCRNMVNGFLYLYSIQATFSRILAVIYE